mgnify:CR=1 FL=1
MMNNKEAIEDIYNRCSNLDKKKDKFFRKRIRQNNPNIKYAAIILCVVLLSSSISVGNNFFTYRSKSSVGYLDEGLYTAISNNYMQNISMKYKKSNNVGVKVTNVLMDNSKIYLVFDFKFYKPLKDNVNLLKLPDMLITNESNDVIYCDNLQKYNEFCKNNNLDLKSNSTDIKEFLCSNYTSQFIEKDQNHIKYLIILNAKDRYPNSTKLNISFDTLSLYGNFSLDEYTKVTPITKTGNWNMEVKLENKKMDNNLILKIKDNEYISNAILSIGETCSHLTFNKNTDFDLNSIEILDGNNQSYSPLDNMDNAITINGNMISVFLPITASFNLSNLNLHIISSKFDRKFKFIKE